MLRHQGSPFKVQVRPTDFNLRVKKKSHEYHLRSYISNTCKKLPFVEIWYRIREEYSQLSEKDY